MKSLDSNDLDSLTENEIRAACERIAGSSPFRSSPRMVSLLKYVVEKTLNGQTDQLKEYTLGVEVFERSDSFDPKIDTIVRVEARRLRRKLAEYYESEGSAERVHISLPGPGYLPKFTAAAPLPQTAAVQLVKRRAWLTIAASVLTLITAAVLAFRFWPSKPQIDSIAVLPFSDLSPAKDQEYFCDGFTEELVTLLAQTKDLRVVARTSSFAFKGKAVDIRTVGRQLSADAIVEGSVRRDKGNLRITAQLIRVSDGYHLWANSYDRRTEDVLAVERELGEIIASVVRKQFRKDLSNSKTERVANLQAYDLCLLGRYHWNKFTPDDLQKAIGYFEQAIALEPNSAQAYSGLADAYSYMVDLDYRPTAEILPTARAVADRALQLNPNSAEAHTARGLVAHELEWDQARARQEFLRAIELDPNYAYGIHWYAHYLEASNRIDEGAQEMSKAVALDPLARFYRFDLAMIRYKQRKYDEALRDLARVQELEPGFVALDFGRGAVQAAQHQWAEAIASFRKSSAVMEGNPEVLAMLAQATAFSGDMESARKQLATLKDLQKRSYVPEYLLALVEYATNDREAGHASLARAIQARTGFLVWLKNTPAFDQIAADPKGAELLGKVGGRFI